MQCTTTLRLAARCAALMGVLAITSTSSRAQSFNIDIGTPNTVPGDGYGAASGQIGHWVNLPAGLPSVQTPLTDVSGNTTLVTAAYTPAIALTFDNGATSGNDANLLDDAQRFSLPNVWTFVGLAPGNYDVFTYAWAPDHPLVDVTRVTVVGSADPPQEVGGQTWTGGFVQGGQYARHHVSIASGGLLEIQLALVSNMAGTINGLQIVHDGIGTSSSYCTAGISSDGCVPSIHGIGTPSVIMPAGFTIECQNVGGNKFGVIFYGVTGQQATPWGNGGTSFLCVRPPFQRTGEQSSGGTPGSCDGVLSIDWNAYMTLNPLALGHPRYLGQQFDAQGWYRDPPSPKTTQLTNGLHFVLGL